MLAGRWHRCCRCVLKGAEIVARLLGGQMCMKLFRAHAGCVLYVREETAAAGEQ